MRKVWLVLLIGCHVQLLYAQFVNSCRWCASSSSASRRITTRGITNRSGFSNSGGINSSGGFNNSGGISNQGGFTNQGGIINFGGITSNGISCLEGQVHIKFPGIACSPRALLHNNGTFLVNGLDGNFPTGVGATRMIFTPGRGIFVAGRATGAQWNNPANYSATFGTNNLPEL